VDLKTALSSLSGDQRLPIVPTGDNPYNIGFRYVSRYSEYDYSEFNVTVPAAYFDKPFNFRDSEKGVCEHYRLATNLDALVLGEDLGDVFWR
jgi:hypothetical protein